VIGEKAEVRRVKLSPGMARELRFANRTCQAASRVLGAAIVEAMHEAARREIDWWDRIAQLADYEGLEDAERQGHLLKLDWVTGEIIVLEARHRASTEAEGPSPSSAAAP
jgi:hypothetical protein